MKSFMFLFKGLPNGWEGVPGIYTITVKGYSKEEALRALAQRYKNIEVKRVTELGRQRKA